MKEITLFIENTSAPYLKKSCSCIWIYTWYSLYYVLSALPQMSIPLCSLCFIRVLSSSFFFITGGIKPS
ncbi:hypothetical protein HMPREF0983_00549 [Erysipelotrichaceae bacterium 3_1_53]|nr:hypothetical protein HMPREF0983_00549 [Erysipelotrichaceae bacterium 3_1_53]